MEVEALGVWIHQWQPAGVVGAIGITLEFGGRQLDTGQSTIKPLAELAKSSAIAPR